MAGILGVQRKIPARCPYCNRAIDLTDFVKELFRRILITLRDEGNVMIQGFGFLHVKVQKRFNTAQEGVYKNKQGQLIHIGEKKILHLQTAREAKNFLNTPPPPPPKPRKKRRPKKQRKKTRWTITT